LAVSLRSNTLKVIDFGGASGTHFFMAKAILGNSVKLDWRIVETPGMVQAVTEAGLNNAELSFFDSLDRAASGQKFDLIFSSCSLNYAPDPYSVLDELVKIQAKYLMITRTPIADRGAVLLQNSMISHNGPGNLPKDMLTIDRRISYPVTILERSKVERSLKEFGEILLRLEEEKQAYQSKDSQYDFWGYLVKR
jgi:putative methyltransferase (TIGR04325 family)